ncbi:biopolymer transporter Tol [bacterium]|jgi:TolB protein|nr:biopolymer transporter Tol [Planctomicrobium sp.]MDA7527953.1 biopolymer transporter Tol [bacterium]MDB4793392.1 biopolymer transporter Tol [bacterium]
MSRTPLLLGLLLSLTTTVVLAEENASVQEAKHLTNIKQVTFGLPRAGEGYFSPDGKAIIFQAYPIGYPFYQIYVQNLDERVPKRVSPGRGRTTCAYFSRDGDSLLFASAHVRPDLDKIEKDARDLAAAGGRRSYAWDFDPYMDIYVTSFDGSKLTQLTDAEGYDAEGSYSHDGKHIVFTSSRDGDPDIYVMDADGKNVRQVVNKDGYDGGPFFSPDDKWILFRSDRDKEHMLQLYVVSVDGKHEFQLTSDLNTVNWAPYYHPSGDYIVWARADYSRGPRGANFDIYSMQLNHEDGKILPGEVERITHHEKADVLPVFSPDGKKLMWTSSRTDDASSQLWIADWKKDGKE